MLDLLTLTEDMSEDEVEAVCAALRAALVQAEAAVQHAWLCQALDVPGVPIAAALARRDALRGRLRAAEAVLDAVAFRPW